LLLGSAPTEGRISGIVDIPNACCTLYVPTAILDFDIRPVRRGRVAETAESVPSRPER
jgi:formamidase